MAHNNKAPHKKPALRFGFKDDPYELNAKDILDLVHQEIHCEHSLISHRMTWYVTSQSFLMASFTIAASNSGNCTATTTSLLWLTKFIPVLGGLTSMVTAVSLYAAIASMHQLKDKENEILKGLDEYIPFAKIRGNADSFNSIHFWGMLPPKLFPIVFLFTWIYCGFMVGSYCP
jgi:hypothetical protein